MVTAIQVDDSQSSSSSSVRSEAASSDDEIKHKNSRKKLFRTQSQRRRSRRITTAPILKELARHIVSSQQPVLFITGAGLSAASGIRTFRGPDGLWSHVVWQKATREEFRKDPLGWYNDFWLKHFPPHIHGEFYEPNEGHEAISTIASLPNTNVRVITQNIDGLHCRTKKYWNCEQQLVEAHGRLGYYKCIPDKDSDSDSDEDNSAPQRTVRLGNRRKKQQLLHSASSSFMIDSTASDKRTTCRYEFAESIPASLIEPSEVRTIISGIYTEQSHDRSTLDTDYALALQLQTYINGDIGSSRQRNKLLNKTDHNQTFINEPPRCPSCSRPVLPQALQFDESYHSHGHYQFERMEDWINEASVIVFIGTSFAVTLTQKTLDHARRERMAVYNFNIDSESLDCSSWLNAENVIGDVQRTLPELVKFCEEEIAATSDSC